jgi:protein subunit release factor B
MNQPQTRAVHATDRESLERDCEVEFIVASGPGGQHRNRNATGVRLRHVATGIVVTATERRSQRRNLDTAFERMAKKLEALNRPRKQRRPTRPSASARRARLDEKRKQSQKKMQRRGPKNNDE